MEDKFGTIAVTIGVLSCIVVAICVGIICFHIADVHDRTPHTSQYPMTTVVVDVSEPNDTVTCRDFNGNLWQFSGVEDWVVGDVASLLMDDAGTPMIKDDIVLDARYDGWFAGWEHPSMG